MIKLLYCPKSTLEEAPKKLHQRHLYLLYSDHKYVSINLVIKNNLAKNFQSFVMCSVQVKYFSENTLQNEAIQVFYVLN